MGFMIGPYSGILLIFSAVITVIASYLAFDLYVRKLPTTGNLRGSWLTSGSIILGIGIWGMQFIGIFAYVPINGLSLDLVYVIFTFFISIILSYFSAYLLKLKLGTILSSFLFAVTVCTTNFIGWEAFRGTVNIELNVPLFFVNFFIGCIGIFLSLYWANSLKNKNKYFHIVKLTGGILFGLMLVTCRYLISTSLMISVAGQHMTALSVNMSVLAIGIGIITIILLLFVLFGSFFMDKVTARILKHQVTAQNYQSLYEQNPDLIVTFDLDRRFLSVNRVSENYGFSEEEIINQSFVALMAPDQLEKAVKNYEAAKSGESVNYDSAFFDKKGKRIEVNISNFPIMLNSQIVGVYAVIKDITEFKKAQVALAEAEDKYRSLTENSLVGSYITQEGMFVYANRKLLELLGVSEEELIGSNVMDYIYSEDHPLIYENVKKRIEDQSATAHYQYRMIKKDKSILYVENFGSAMIYQGQPAAIGTIIDITSRKKAEETIEYMAFHDSLTGLLDRHSFDSHLMTSLAKGTTERLALLFIDLDEFELIDDTLGPEMGDQLLKDVSERLKNCVPYHGEMGRNRGDEFLVFLPNADKNDVTIIAESMVSSLSAPFYIDRYELYVTPSIGISLYPNDTEDKDDLIKKAESAMHQVKKGEKNGYQFNDLSHPERSNDRLELEVSLRKALKHGEFQLYYQPKFDLTTGKIKGVEALIRWIHPEKGLISPGDFIPLAEEMGLIIPIGEWVLRTACVQAKDWQSAGLAPFEMSVNLSVRQIYQPNLVEMVAHILQETGLDPKYLELEVTESMMADSEHMLNVLNELKKLGLKISLDDFGTGYSSLHYLKGAPIDTLKVDKSFVRHCTEDVNDATIVKTIIAMAHQLKLEVIAEGVETTEHLVFLQQNVCDIAQGFLFSKPLPAEELLQDLHQIERIVAEKGIPKDLQDNKWLEKTLEIAGQELLDTIRLQQGMTFKFIEEDGKFIHTLCDGELIYKLGLAPEKVIGHELRDFQSHSEAERKAQYFRRAWEGERDVHYEAQMNGIYYLASLRPVIRGGRVVEVIASCVDITERKRMEEALKQSELNNRLIAEQMSDFIIVVNVKGLVTYASPSHEEIFGFPSKSLEGGPISNLIEPDDLPNIQEKFNHMLTSKSAFQMEYRFKYKEGMRLYLEAQWIPVFDENGDIKHIVVASRDITAKKRR